MTNPNIKKDLPIWPEGILPFNYHILEEWNSHPKIFHGFGTRRDGGKKERKDWLGQSLKIEGKEYPVVALRQKHGDGLTIFNGEAPKDLWSKEGDALLTKIPGYALAVFTADCFPILIFDPRQEAVGIVHAGWRGTAKGVVAKVIKKMRDVFKSSVEDMQIAIGPGICPTCLEVDAPVREAFAEFPVPWQKIAIYKGKNKWFLDIYQANFLLIKSCGVKEENIFSFEACPSCHLNEYYSYRGERKSSGRMINFVGLKL